MDNPQKINDFHLKNMKISDKSNWLSHVDPSRSIPQLLAQHLLGLGGRAEVAGHAVRGGCTNGHGGTDDT
jgi:hypothetical protein